MEPIIISFDVETTGKNAEHDQVVEISICVHDGPAEPHVYHARIRPEVSITPGARRIHGISMEDLADAPAFARVADEIEAIFRSAEVVVGYNVRFDVRFLEREFERIGRTLDLSAKTIVDPLRIWHAMEPRRLENACVRFAGAPLDGAHSATEDAVAVMRVLQGMRGAFGLESAGWDELAALSEPDRERWIGPSGHIRWESGEIVIGFGKYDGRRLLDVARDDPGYLRWVQGKDFPAHVHSLCKGALLGLSDEAFQARIVEFYGPAPEEPMAEV